MIYTFINLCVLVGVICFYKFCLRKQISFDTSTFFPLVNVCIMQTVFVCFLYILDLTGIYLFIFNRIYIFSVYYCLLVLFRFTYTFEIKEIPKVVKYITALFLIPIAYYCFFYLKIDQVAIDASLIEGNKNHFFSNLNFDHYAYTPYILILPILSIIVLIVRAMHVKDTVLRFKFILFGLVLFSVFFFYIILVNEGNSKRPLNFLFPLATLYIILVLYRISLISHVMSFRKALKVLRAFCWEYMLFAVFVTVAFIFFFYALSINIVVFSILGTITILALFFAQALARKKNQASFLRDTADVTLGNFFSNIDYSSSRENLLMSFSSMLTEVFDSSGIEFFILEKDELSVIHSTRNFYKPKLSVHSKLYLTLSQSEVSVISKGTFHKEKKLIGNHEEMACFFQECDSHIMIAMHGERNIIGLISFGAKKRSIHYSRHDENLMHYFYPNFFVFCYYLQISMKESLMKIIGREIEFSGQVTESIYKNIDPINNSAIDLGYLSRSLRNLGGDFIDLIRLTATRHMFVIGDVSGRGLNASMCMIILKSFIRTFLRDSNDFIGLLDKLNSFIKHNLPRGIFFAGTFMIFDSSTNMLYYVNCGVPGIFLYTKSYNNVIEIQGEGKVLGFIDNVGELLNLKKIQLNEGDIVLTCSDGVTESLSLRGEEYGKRRIENLLLENKLFPSQNICSFLYDDLQAFTAKGITDDVSILLLKVLQ